MAITFGGATSDVVDFGTGVGTNGAGKHSIWCWVYPTTLTGGRFIWSKNNAATGRVRILRINSTDTSRLESFTANPTTATAISASSTLVVNVWQFICVTWDDLAGASGATPKIYYGRLDQSIAEVSYFSTAPVTGVTATDDGKFVCGNRTAADTLAFQGRIAEIGYVDNRVLSLGEMKQVAAAPFPVANTKLLSHLGFNGTGSQPDSSGQKHAGTVTGATLSAHVPIKHPFIFDSGVWVPYAVASAPATTGTVVMRAGGNLAAVGAKGGLGAVAMAARAVLADQAAKGGISAPVIRASGLLASQASRTGSGSAAIRSAGRLANQSAKASANTGAIRSAGILAAQAIHASSSTASIRANARGDISATRSSAATVSMRAYGYAATSQVLAFSASVQIGGTARGAVQSVRTGATAIALSGTAIGATTGIRAASASVEMRGGAIGSTQTIRAATAQVAIRGTGRVAASGVRAGSATVSMRASGYVSVAIFTIGITGPRGAWQASTRKLGALGSTLRKQGDFGSSGRKRGTWEDE